MDAVTNRYTEALFSLASRRGVLETVQRDVSALTRELAAAGGSDYYMDARIPLPERRQRVLSKTAGMHELVRNFVGLLFDKRREGVLEHIGEALHRRLLDEQGATEGVVESARPLGVSEISRLAVALGGRLGKEVSLENRIVPELIGGVRVIVGSRMLDVSLKGRLEDLRRRMLEVPLPSPQEV